ncbi:WUSCHEL-related homeobox 9-like [Euphorbia lathyris]|uniref:WUSCHEL-related homeobox 9-like n=1 Tax=Euphorbia lathyris TaxID=212925 RepID=UPI003313817A
MASSNRHWPSMFKSKPCNTNSHHHHHQWQHEINSSSLLSSGCNRSPYTSVAGCEERSPEPKPRWNPKPEQIRILEAIFNSGMVNPPRDEIRKIRAQLQEYGQVGDANVFYWFQNRKSRSKHKLRLLQNSSKQQQNSPNLQAPSSSSSSSEKSPPNSSKRTLSLNSQTVLDLSNSPTASVNQNTYFQPHNEFTHEPFFFPTQHTATGAVPGTGTGSFTQGFCFSDLSNVVQVQDHSVGPCTNLLLSEIVNNSDHHTSKKDDHHKNMKMQPMLDYSFTTPNSHTLGLAPPFPLSFTDHTNGITTQGVGEGETGNGRSMVFINDVAFEIGVGPFNVREAFGDENMLIHSSGHPVFTNEWGITLHSLQHGASYYLVPLSITEHI